MIAKSPTRAHHVPVLTRVCGACMGPERVPAAADGGALPRLLADLTSVSELMTAYGIDPALADCGTVALASWAHARPRSLTPTINRGHLHVVHAVLASALNQLCALAYGQLINRAELCTPSSGIQIQLNLAQLEDWTLQRSFSDGTLQGHIDEGWGRGRVTARAGGAGEGRRGYQTRCPCSVCPRLPATGSDLAVAMGRRAYSGGRGARESASAGSQVFAPAQQHHRGRGQRYGSLVRCACMMTMRAPCGC